MNRSDALMSSAAAAFGYPNTRTVNDKKPNQKAQPVETNAQYHSDTEWASSSMLKALLESPRKYEGRYNAKPGDDNYFHPMEADHFDVGTAVHMLLLEGKDEFYKQFAVSPAGNNDRRLKAWKTWSRETRKEQPDARQIRNSDFRIVQRCIRSMRSLSLIHI